jgi:hypothetical protein
MLARTAGAQQAVDLVHKDDGRLPLNGHGKHVPHLQAAQVERKQMLAGNVQGCSLALRELSRLSLSS